MAQQTAVEWLFNELFCDRFLSEQLIELREQAKQMEKQQIMDAFDIRKVDIAFDKKTTSEQYYTQTYGNNTKID